MNNEVVWNIYTSFSTYFTSKQTFLLSFDRFWLVWLITEVQLLQQLHQDVTIISIHFQCCAIKKRHTKWTMSMTPQPLNFLASHRLHLNFVRSLTFITVRYPRLFSSEWESEPDLHCHHLPLPGKLCMSFNWHLILLSQFYNLFQYQQVSTPQIGRLTSSSNASMASSASKPWVQLLVVKLQENLQQNTCTAHSFGLWWMGILA